VQWQLSTSLFAYAMRVAIEGQTSARKGRCANHPAVARVGVCEMCGKPLCLSCAVPVRGRVIGPECLPKVLVDASEPVPIPRPISTRGNVIAAFGFGVVLFASVFPWSRFGDSSRYLGAWSRHWSLVAVVAALLGLAVIAIGRARPIDLRVESAILAVLAMAAGAAAFLHHRNPPLLSAPTSWPWLAVVGGAIAFLGAVVQMRSVVMVRRPLPPGSLPS
jgi:hypothetical protein